MSGYAINNKRQIARKTANPKIIGSFINKLNLLRISFIFAIIVFLKRYKRGKNLLRLVIMGRNIIHQGEEFVSFCRSLS
jgi:hypothetical protein